MIASLWCMAAKCSAVYPCKEMTDKYGEIETEIALHYPSLFMRKLGVVDN